MTSIPDPESGVQGRPPGRPRDTTIDDTVMDTVVGLIDEDGLGSLSVEGIASCSGVSKAAIYRRWPTKGHVVIDTVVRMAEQFEVTASDDVRSDLVAVVRRLRTFLSSRPAGSVFPWLVGEVASGSPIGRHYADSVIMPRRRAVAELIARAQRAGSLSADLDLETSVDLLLGPVLVRAMLGTLSAADDQWPERVVDGLLDAWIPDSGCADTPGEITDPVPKLH